MRRPAAESLPHPLQYLVLETLDVDLDDVGPEGQTIERFNGHFDRANRPSGAKPILCLLFAQG